MSNSDDLSFHGTLPLAVFEQLSLQLHQMAQVIKEDVVVLSEQVLVSIPVGVKPRRKFTVIISHSFSALLLGALPRTREEALEELQNQIRYMENSDRAFKVAASFHPQDTSINVDFSFNRDAIARFLLQLSNLDSQNTEAFQTLARSCQDLQHNDAQLQSYFTVLLLSVLMRDQQDAAPTYPHVSVCQPVEDALQEQFAHERLLNQLTNQIRQSLDLAMILSTAVNHVRDFLQIDRLMIYQFEQQLEARKNDSGVEFGVAEHGVQSFTVNSKQQHSGCVVYEARATDTIPSMLHYREESCFVPTSGCWEKYRQGFTLAVDDIEQTYVLSQCLLEFLRASQVQAKLAAPIVFEEKLWGLLIAHQCSAPRHWRDSEKNLLRRIAEQLAIAIHQAELMQSLTLEKQTLEQRVLERTQALEEALIAAQAASRVKSEFLATMSHELRSPLTSIIGLSATLLRWQMGKLTERQRQYIQTIHHSGEHLLVLINDILALSEIEAGKGVLESSEFSLRAIAQASLHSFTSMAARQAVELRLDFEVESNRDRFCADPKRIQQILWNLLSNAVKFTPAGGQVTLRVWRENQTAVFQVEDTGIGIPKHQLSLLFEFQQLGSPYDRQYEGTGLGLALTKHLVELHQGRIEVDSVVGGGSTFTVWVPMVRGEERGARSEG